MELRQLLDILLRRKWLVVQAFLVIFLVVMAATFIRPASYEAISKILYEPVQVEGSLLSTIGINGLMNTGKISKNDANLRTKMALIKVAPMLNKVIERLQVRDRSGNLLDPAKMTDPGILARILVLPAVEVSQEPESDEILITATSSNPSEAQAIANNLAELYIEQNGEAKKDQSRNARRFVESQLGDVKQAYFEQLERISNFQQKHNTVDLDAERKMAIEKIADLMKAKEASVIDTEQALAKVRTLKGQVERNAVSTSMLKENPQVEVLKKDLATLKLKLADVLTEKTENHPDAVAVKRQIAQEERELSAEVARYRESVPQLNELEQQIASSKARLGGINKDLNLYSRQLRTLPETSKEAEKLKLALTSSQDIYSSLLDYRQQIGIAEAMAVNDLRPVQSAGLPATPKSPNKPLNAAIGIFLGLVFGVGLAVVTEYADDTIMTAEEIEPLGLRVLGQIPRMATRLIDRLDSNDPLTEAYRAIRNTLKFASSNGNFSTLLVTSSGPREGKTTIVANLGVSYARAGVKTLVVDGDLRRPGLHRVFRKPNDCGLASVVSGECTIDQAVMATSFPGLDLLAAGPLKTDASWIIESERMLRLVEVLARRYEVVIFDSAPPLIKSDVGILGHYVDATIQVIERGKVTHAALEKTYEIFQKCGVEPIGVVLNRFETKKPPLIKLRGYRTFKQKIVLAVVAVLLGGAVVGTGYYLLMGSPWHHSKPVTTTAGEAGSNSGKVLVTPAAR
jgi:capsular exopolysaccharide synthesis family protein